MKPTKLLLDFSEINRNDISIVGGKGANLGEMTSAGFPVPKGFCVTTRAYKMFLESSEKSKKIFQLLDGISIADVEEVRHIGKKVREYLQDGKIPPPVIKELKEHLRNFEEQTPFAVRSSATAEDLPEASFAGQQDTYLNVIGEADILEAVKQCWISLFTDRAILYRSMNNFGHREIKLSVVVQEMVLAERSGIMFTADPLTGNRHISTIDASFGLGEALVSGLVTPDTYRIDKRSGDIIELKIGEKEVSIVPHKSGGTTRVKIDNPESQVLQRDEILALVEMGNKIEEHYNTPQDIEWGMVKNKIYLLQTRPITSLYPIDGLQREDGRYSVYFSLGHQQSMTQPMSPLGQSSIRILLPIGRSGIDQNVLVKPSGDRLFVDITLALRHRLMRKGILTLLSQFDALAPDALKLILKKKELKQVKRRGIPLRTYFFGMHMLRKIQFNLWFKKVDGFVKKTNSLCDEFIDQTSRRINSCTTSKEKIETIFDVMRNLFPFFINWVPEAIAGNIATKLITKQAAKWLSEDELKALTLGIPGNVVNEMNLEIGNLADVARHFPELVQEFSNLNDDGHSWLNNLKKIEGGEEFLVAWDKFIEKYGSRGPSEIDIAEPRWYEDPLPLLRVVGEYLKRDEKYYHSHFQTMVEERELVFNKLLTSSRKGPLGRLRRRRFKRLYYVMKELGGLREHHKFLAVRVLAIVKEHLKNIAQELVEANKLEKKDDIWFLSWSELLSIWDDSSTDWHSVVQSRREDYLRNMNFTPPMIITSDGETPIVNYTVSDAPDNAILGNPVSPGIVTGTVHVVRNPQKETLSPGEILVTEFTDPGWTPLFINAGGLILEVGGALTHGAVVAREYGIPAVVGVRNATHILKTGQKVKLDGNRGVIEIIE